MVLLPTGLSLDDQPSVLLAHELVKKGIPRTRIAFVPCRVGDGETEINAARQCLGQARYKILPGSLAEKLAYRRASDECRAVTEPRFSSLFTDQLKRLKEGGIRWQVFERFAQILDISVEIGARR